MLKSKSLIVLSLLLSIGCSGREIKYWESIKEVGNLSSYQEYIDNYPDGKYLQEAENKIQEIVIENAREEGTLIAYNDYLDRFPEGNFAQEAREFILIENAKVNDSIEDYREYLYHFPKGKFSQEASSRLEEILINRAREKQSHIDYRLYLRLFPEGSFTEEANIFLKELEEKEEASKRQKELADRQAEAARNAFISTLVIENHTNSNLSFNVSGATSESHNISEDGSLTIKLRRGWNHISGSSNCGSKEESLFVKDEEFLIIKYECMNQF